MKRITGLLLFILCSTALQSAFSQDSARFDSDDLIQFTGVVITPDSLIGVPNVNIRIKGTTLGTVTNEQGFFSVVARKNDTLTFTAVGFKPERYIVSPTLTSKKYSMIRTMSQDTFYLTEVIIKPYISKELFQHYFVNMEVPSDQGDLANMDPETLTEMAMAMSMDGTENSKYYLKQEAGKYYYSGQIPPINLMNPFAWAQFIKAWKAGKLKRQTN